MEYDRGKFLKSQNSRRLGSVTDGQNRLPLTAMKKEINVLCFRRKIRRLVLNMLVVIRPLSRVRVRSWTDKPGF